MHFIYNLIVQISWFHLKLVALFHPKIKLFVEGRKRTFAILTNKFSKGDLILWVHVASLGEYEQGLPVIEKLKVAYPKYKILITFFSPSGYEVKKSSSVADVVTYLPMDSQKNVIAFLDRVNPALAIFVKYEIWPNYLRELKQRKIPTMLISAIFTEKQIYFKSYGSFMRKALSSFSNYFVQNEASAKLLKSIAIEEVSISGDTRLDRVSEILENDNQLDFMEAFTQGKDCFVAGSTWPEDEVILIDYINHCPKHLKFVIAPHTIKKENILGLAGAFTKKTALYSKRDGLDMAAHDVLIIDYIGLLTKIYSYADYAYVGGGFATGLHNTMEPAVFGIPVLIGPNYQGFEEAEALVALKGVLPITDNWSFGELMKKLIDNPEFRKKTGAINAAYIMKNKGASARIMQYIRTIL